MSAFFLPTDHSVAGPFTGIELREAARAGVIPFDAIIGGSAKGPWFNAVDVGLFCKEKRTPLPHPQGTEVPNFEVRGLPNLNEGPFQLHELIELAARGMLQGDTEIRRSHSDHWVPAQSIGVLMACLNGEFTRVDASGNVTVRTSVLPGLKDTQVIKRASQNAKPLNELESGCLEDGVLVDDTHLPPATTRKSQAGQAKQKIANLRERNKVPWNIKFQRALESLADPRLAARRISVLLFLAGLFALYSHWSGSRMGREEVLGNWARTVQIDGETKVVFAASFRDDGHLVLFNSKGKCWTGAFDWTEPRHQQNGFDQSFSTTIDQVSDSHQPGPVAASDGYVTFRGFVKDAPQIEGHEVRDFFVRRSGKDLMVGYPLAVHWTPSGRTMEAGWITLKPMNGSQRDVSAGLRQLSQRGAPPPSDYGGTSPPHISEAISVVESNKPSRHRNGTGALQGSIAYASDFDSSDLVAKFGMPDEAREVYQFEKPELDRGPNLDDAQAIRYGNLIFLVSDQGKLRFLARVDAGS